MNELPEYMKPVMSLVVYKTDKSVNTYIEEHAIRELQENKFTFGPGKPARIKILGKLLKEIEGLDKSKYEFEGLIPKNVIYFNTNNQELNLIWTFKKSHINLNFDEKHNISKEFKCVPNLIFKIKDTKLSVYAYKCFKGLETNLFYAPFHNIYNDGRICMGNASIDWNICNLEKLMQHIEQLFFRSKFTHLNHQNFKNNINVIWDKNGFGDSKNLTNYRKKKLKDII